MIDTGVGIAPEAIPKLFRPFTQRSPTASGLQLATMRKIRRYAHGGTIEGRANLKRGTKFTIGYTGRGVNGERTNDRGTRERVSLRTISEKQE